VDGDDFEVVAFESTFEEMGAMAVRDLSTGEGIFMVEGHDHDDGEKCDPIEGRTWSIRATTFDDTKHELMFTPIQARLLVVDLIRFVTGKEVIDETST